MVSNIHLLLGITEDAAWTDVKKAYARLMESLNDQDICCQCTVLDKVKAARERLSSTYEHLKKPDIRRAYNLDRQREAQKETEYCRPKLGQLLVASGLISLEELDAALEIQRNTGTTHVPLGQLLLAIGYLTEQQLDYYLRVQRLSKLPADHPERWGQRLVELGLVTDDQLMVALIEQQNTGSTLREALIKRGWLTAEVLDRIF